MESTIRRRMMMGKKDDYLEGWEYYKALSTQGKEVYGSTSILSPYIDKGMETKSITLTKGVRWCWYDSEYNFVDYWSMNTTTTRTVGSNVRYIRVCFYIEDIDDSYIKDNATNTYLWKGKNVGGVADYQPFSGYSAERSAA